jgi:hypothetical protein
LNKRQRTRAAAFAALSTLLSAALLAGCAQTSAPQPNLTERVENQNPAPPPPSLPPTTAPSTPAPVASNSQLAPPAANQFEAPPVVNASDLLPASALSGPGYSVGQQVPTNGAMGQYTIVADSSVYRSDAGTYQVESLDLLKIRLSEMPAIAKLEAASQ